MVQGLESILPVAICWLEGIRREHAITRFGEGHVPEGIVVLWGTECIVAHHAHLGMCRVEDLDEQSVVDEVDVLGEVCACCPPPQDFDWADGLEVLGGVVWEVGGYGEGFDCGVGMCHFGRTHSCYHW